MSGLLPVKKQFGLYIRNGRWNCRKDDKTILQFDAIVGTIEYVAVKKVTPTEDQDFKEYDALKILVENGEEQYFLSMNAAFSTASNFFNALPLIDPKHQVKFIAYTGDNNFDALKLEQHGLRIANYYTKADPKGKPQWVKTPNGFDKTEELEFFKASVYHFMERLRKSKSTLPTETTTETNFNPAEGFDMPEF